MSTRTVIHIEPWSLGVTDKSPVRLFHLPLPLHGGAAARLFGFIETDSRASAAALLKILEEALAALPAARPATTLPDRVSVLLSSFNRRALEAEKVDAPLILIGAAHKNEVTFSARGRTHALFIPSAKSGEPPSDLARGTGAAPASGLLDHNLLPALTAGTLQNHDTLLFAPHRIMDYLSIKLLQNLFQKKDIDPRAELLKNLEDMGGREALMGVILRAKLEVVPRLALEAISPQASVEELLRKTRATEKLLSPNAFRALPSRISQGVLGVGARFRRLKFILPRMHIKNLPRKSQIALAGGGVLLVAFLVATFIYAGRGGGPVARSEIAAAIKKLDEADAALLYGEEPNAWKLLDEADAHLARVRSVGPAHARAAELRKNLRHEFVIDEPTLVGDLRNVKADANGTVLLKIKETLFVGAGGKEPLIVPFDPVRRHFGDPLLLASAGAPLAATISRGAPLLLTDKEALVTTTADTPVALPIFWRTSAPRAIAFYNERLYALSPGAGAVDRYAFARVGFASGTSAVAPTDALKDARALAIDGALYAGTGKGEIKKFVQGKAQTFNLGKIDPPLGAVTRLDLSLKKPYLAILSPGTKRLIIINKTTGAVVAQYTSTKFDALTDFAIDETQKHIYILNGPQIFAISARHLDK